MSLLIKKVSTSRDMADFASMNAVYGEFFTSNYPARSAIQVAGLPKGGAVEIEAIAYLPG